MDKLYPKRLRQITPQIKTETRKTQNSKNPLCYNGDLFSRQDIDRILAEFPQVEAVMLGRGLVADPGMLLSGGTQIKALEQFHDALLEEYLLLFGGSRNAMFRLKENWSYLLPRFENSEKLGKRLRKTTDVAEFKAITSEIFHTLPLAEKLPSDW